MPQNRGKQPGLPQRRRRLTNAKGIGLLLGALSLYLAFEFAYNAWLLETAGSGMAASNAFSRVETFGRLLSATGITLLTLTLLHGHQGLRLASRWGYYLGLLWMLAFAGATLAIWVDGTGIELSIRNLLGMTAEQSSQHSRQMIEQALSGDYNLFWTLLLVPLGWGFWWLAWHLRWRKAGSLLVVLALGTLLLPHAYHLQYQAIERYIVEPSTPEQRQQAFMLNWVREGYASGEIQIADLVHEGSSLQAEEQAFLALSGPLFMGMTHPLIEQVLQQREAFADRVVEASYQMRREAHYQSYMAIGDRLRQEVWAEYESAYEQAESRIADLPDQAENIHRALVKFLDRYTDRVDHLARHDPNPRDLAQGYTSEIRKQVEKIREAFEAGKDPRSHIEALADLLYEEFPTLDDELTHWSRFCSKAPEMWTGWHPSVLKAEEIRQIDRQAYQAYYEVSAYEVDAEAPRLRDRDWPLAQDRPDPAYARSEPARCPAGESYVTRQLASMIKESLHRDGLAYREYDEPAKKLILEMSPNELERLLAHINEGHKPLEIHQPEHWRADNQQELKYEIAASGRQQINERWIKKVRKQMDMPNLAFYESYRELEQSAPVQRWLREHFPLMRELGLSYDSRWSREQFYERWLMPQIEHKADWLAEHLGQTSAFADGGAEAQQGRSAVRALWIPVIGLSLSLLMGLLGVLKLLYTLVGVLLTRLSGRAWLVRGTQLLLLVSGISAIALLPRQVEHPLLDSALYNHTQEQLAEHGQGWQVPLLDWYLRVQPTIVPIGQQLSVLVDWAKPSGYSGSGPGSDELEAD